MGEAGTEAIMPLARGADGRLGVATQGGGSAVHVTFNMIDTGRHILPQIRGSTYRHACPRGTQGRQNFLGNQS